MRRGIFAALAVALISFVSPVGPAGAADGGLLVFAAASLKNALDAAAQAWEEAGGGEVRISYGSSSALARQIEAGAPADLFISASPQWMNHLEKIGLVAGNSRADLVGNRLVLVAPAESLASLRLEPGLELAAALGEGRLAMADTEAVPAGIYGKAALATLGVWDEVSRRVVQAQDVRGALALVARGEAPLGVVYRSDAVAEPRVRVVDIFPESSHEPIVYPAALMASSETQAGPLFLRFLTSERAAPYFMEQGFTIHPPGR